MALQWFDGGEIWGDSTYHERAYLSGTAATDATNPRLSPGTRSIQFSTGFLTTPSLGEQNTWTVGFGLNLTTSVSTFRWRFMRAGVEQCRIEAVDNGSTFDLRLMRGATEIDRTAVGFTANIWHYFEVQITVRDGTDGAYEIRQNEVEVLSGTGENLAAAGADGCDAHSFGVNSASATARVDDVYMLDSTGATNNDFLGDVVIVGILPTAEGATNNFTPSTGADNSALVDDPAGTASAADYVSSDTNGHRDLYEYSDLPVTGLGTIFGVRVATDAAMTSVGSRVMKPVYRSSGGTVADGDDFAVDGVGIVSRSVIMETNPVTSIGWAKSDVDDGQFGVEVVS